MLYYCTQALVFLYFEMFQSDDLIYDDARLMDIAEDRSASLAARLAALDVLHERLDLTFAHDYVEFCAHLSVHARAQGCYLLARAAEFNAEDAREMMREIEREFNPRVEFGGSPCYPYF